MPHNMHVNNQQHCVYRSILKTVVRIIHFVANNLVLDTYVYHNKDLKV